MQFNHYNILLLTVPVGNSVAAILRLFVLRMRCIVMTLNVINPYPVPTGGI